MGTIYFRNLGIYQTHFNVAQLKPVWDEVKKIEADWLAADPSNDRLVGNIAKEFRLHDCLPQLDKLLRPEIAKWDQDVGWLGVQNQVEFPTPIKLIDAWVNFMKPGEYNPTHNHPGVISWIMWLKIPFTRDGEAALHPYIPKERALGGTTNFSYTNILGTIQHFTYPLETIYEGDCVLFPAPLYHTVYPFQSTDEYRISVAGNYALDNTIQPSTE
jgi:Putative 2OG-Fe(II) oxygenase